MANEKITICHSNETIRVDESAVQAHLDHGDSLGSCDPNSGIDVRENYPEKIVDFPLIEEALDSVQWIIDNNDYRDIRDKYRDFTSLDTDVMREIINEYGYGYIFDILDVPISDTRRFLGILNIVKYLKGSKVGLEIVLNLISKGHSIIEWWEFQPGNVNQWNVWGISNDVNFVSGSQQNGIVSATNEPDTFYIQVFIDEEVVRANSFFAFATFLRHYEYPLALKIDWRALFIETFIPNIIEEFVDNTLDTVETDKCVDVTVIDEDALFSNTDLHLSNNLLNILNLITIIDTPASSTDIIRTDPIFGTTTTGTSNGTFFVSEQVISSELSNPITLFNVISTTSSVSVFSNNNFNSNTISHHSNNTDNVFIEIIISGDTFMDSDWVQDNWTQGAEETVKVFSGQGMYSNSNNLLSSFQVIGTQDIVIDTIVIDEVSHQECDINQISITPQTSWDEPFIPCSFAVVDDNDFIDRLAIQSERIYLNPSLSVEGENIYSNRIGFSNSIFFHSFLHNIDLITGIIQIVSEIYLEPEQEFLHTIVQSPLLENRALLDVLSSNSTIWHSNNVDVTDGDLVLTTVIDAPETIINSNCFVGLGDYSNSSNLISNPSLESLTINSIDITIEEVSHQELVATPSTIEPQQFSNTNFLSNITNDHSNNLVHSFSLNTIIDVPFQIIGQINKIDTKGSNSTNVTVEVVQTIIPEINHQEMLPSPIVVTTTNNPGFSFHERPFAIEEREDTIAFSFEENVPMISTFNLSLLLSNRVNFVSNDTSTFGFKENFKQRSELFILDTQTVNEETSSMSLVEEVMNDLDIIMAESFQNLDKQDLTLQSNDVNNISNQMRAETIALPGENRLDIDLGSVDTTSIEAQFSNTAFNSNVFTHRSNNIKNTPLTKKTLVVLSSSSVENVGTGVGGFKASFSRLFSITEENEPDSIDRIDLNTSEVIETWEFPYPISQWEAYYLEVLI